MRTIVDRTTDALDVEVCSVYLMERDGARLRLAATNGLDRDQIGSVTLAVGEGLTGRAAQIGQPVASPDVRVDPRFKWVPGFDQSQFVSMLSVPAALERLDHRRDQRPGHRDARPSRPRRSSSW